MEDIFLDVSAARATRRITGNSSVYFPEAFVGKGLPQLKKKEGTTTKIQFFIKQNPWMQRIENEDVELGTCVTGIRKDAPFVDYVEISRQPLSKQNRPVSLTLVSRRDLQELAFECERNDLGSNPSGEDT